MRRSNRFWPWQITTTSIPKNRRIFFKQIHRLHNNRYPNSASSALRTIIRGLITYFFRWNWVYIDDVSLLFVFYYPHGEWEELMYFVWWELKKVITSLFFYFWYFEVEDFTSLPVHRWNWDGRSCGECQRFLGIFLWHPIQQVPRLVGWLQPHSSRSFSSPWRNRNSRNSECCKEKRHNNTTRVPRSNFVVVWMEVMLSTWCGNQDRGSNQLDPNKRLPAGRDPTNGRCWLVVLLVFNFLPPPLWPFLDLLVGVQR